MSEATQIQAIAQQIDAYLMTHPGAADSLDGIASGWLGLSRISRPSLDLARKAVELLLVNGCIQKTTTDTGAVVYRTARKK